MTITLQQIQERKDHLKQEILERECLLATLEVLHRHVAAAGGSKTIDHATVFPAWIPEQEAAAPARQAMLSESVPAPLPAPPVPEPYIHPDLKKIGYYHGSNTRHVRWAIERLTGDYTLPDIQALLAREGRPMQSAEISVVLSRLKKRGKITEIQCGRGRNPSIFRKSPENSSDPTPAGV